jgi:hypothetical protein
VEVKRELEMGIEIEIEIEMGVGVVRIAVWMCLLACLARVYVCTGVSVGLCARCLISQLVICCFQRAELGLAGLV